jgi:hypothetical protein
MIIAYCFIGPLPSYAIDTVYQTRLFTKMDIYFIINDYDSPIAKELEQKYNVIIIRYDTVKDNIFNDIIEEHWHKFTIINELKGREKIFIYSYERFFCLKNLMIQNGLTNVFFMELDNLIYEDPIKWIQAFETKDIAFMFDDNKRCASGICYIKNIQIINVFTDYCIKYIELNKPGEVLFTEMHTLFGFIELDNMLVKNKPDYIQKCQLLPTHWTTYNEKIPFETYQNYDLYNKSIFDSSGIGIYLGGYDPYHTQGIITTGVKNVYCIIDYTIYNIKWVSDDMNRDIPYIFNDVTNEWIRINNLHIHSKDLKTHLSI